MSLTRFSIRYQPITYVLLAEESVAELVPLPRHGDSRFMLSASALTRFRTELLPDVAKTYLGHRLGLYFNCNLLEDIPKAGGFYSLYLTEQLDTIFALYAPTNGIAPALADFMSVSQVSSETNMLEWAVWCLVFGGCWCLVFGVFSATP